MKQLQIQRQQDLIGRMYEITEMIERIRHALDDMTSPLPYTSKEQTALMRAGNGIRIAEKAMETAVEDMPHRDDVGT